MNEEKWTIGERASRFEDEAAVRGAERPSYGPLESGREREGEGSGRRFELPFDLKNLRRGEWWLNKIGIVLFLIGIVLLFKFSYEKGWVQDVVTPVMRVGLGILAGTALVGVGLRVYEDRRAFAQVVLGGGIGTYYITGFAAFQMLGVFSYPVAFAFMAMVSVLAFALSVRQDEAVLAVTGVSGGLATPFLLYDGDGALGGLVLYAALVVAGAMGIYLLKGWRSLPLVSSFGLWTVLLLGYAGAVASPEAVSSGSAMTLQAGVFFGWISLWLVPAAREALRAVNPDRWRLPEPGHAARYIFEGVENVLWNGTTARVLSVATPLVALLSTLIIWDGDRTIGGLAALVIAVGHGLAWVGLGRAGEVGWTSRVQGLVALPFATASVFLLLGGDALFVALAVEAAALHYVARRAPVKAVSVLAHVISLTVSIWLLGRLSWGGLGYLVYPTIPYRPLDFHGLADLTVLVLIAVSSLFVAGKKTVLAYRASAHAGLLAWLWCGLYGMPGSAGDALVTVAWGVVGAGLFVAGLRRDNGYLIKGGMATLFLVVGKLILWDLAWAEPILRVLLFLGFGGLFLILSYYLRNLWNPGNREEAPETAPELPEPQEELPNTQP